MAQPYQVAVPEEKLELLRAKLALTTFPDELEDGSWSHGAPLQDIKRLTKHWQESFSWRDQEAKLNELPNFHTTIKIKNHAPLDIHFLHQRSPSPNAIPLLFVHGWPGSYLEATKLLTTINQTTSNVSFHLIAPSLPNFGWSSAPSKTGFGLAQYAETLHNLMQSLGYTHYATHGGDWGFYITRTLGLLYPTSVLASHITLIRANPPQWTTHPLLALQHAVTPYSTQEKEGMERTNWFLNEGSGYRLIQSTKPQTVAYGLTDSPVGLLAWIYEKLHDWTDSYSWSDDEILTWVSIYLFSTAGAGASLRIYYEATHAPSPSSPSAGEAGEASAYVSRDRTQQFIPHVKLGLCHTPKELALFPLTWCRTLGPVVFESRKAHGGHFLAHEEPEELEKDLRAMFGKGGPCYRLFDTKAKANL